MAPSEEHRFLAETDQQRYVDHLAFEQARLRHDQRVHVTRAFREIIDTFRPPRGQTPPGFRLDWHHDDTGIATVDLVRDIAYDSNSRRRPTPLLFSVDSVNPSEIAPWSRLVANLTCNPGIVYDLFLNDPEKNVGNQFGTIDEVLREIGRILGPGCDISVELHNPYETNFNAILDEVLRYESILGKHRLVVKVPHTGPIGPGNWNALLSGDGRFPIRYDNGHPEDYLRGHNLALELESRGYRVNFTLMFEPHQTPLALQARPYFVNAFLRNRLNATRKLKGLLAAWEASADRSFLVQMRDWFISNDFLAEADADMDLLTVLMSAKTHLRNRTDGHPEDGLDAARQSLRWLAASNLTDTRLILCSMEGDEMFPDICNMLVEPEFVLLQDRVLITTDPVYLSRWTSSPQVISYQRRFMRAASTAAN